MACPVQRRVVIPRSHVDPDTFAVIPAGYAVVVGPCTRKSKGKQLCKSCLAGRWGDHDKPTKRGKQQIERARQARKEAVSCAG